MAISFTAVGTKDIWTFFFCCIWASLSLSSCFFQTTKSSKERTTARLQCGLNSPAASFLQDIFKLIACQTSSRTEASLLKKCTNSIAKSVCNAVTQRNSRKTRQEMFSGSPWEAVLVPIMSLVKWNQRLMIGSVLCQKEDADFCPLLSAVHFH